MAISFSDRNPAIDAYQRGTRLAMDMRSTDLRDQAQEQANIENEVSAPSRLRQIDATSRTAVAGANVAEATAPHKIIVSEEQAKRAPIQTEREGVQLQQDRGRLAGIGIQNARGTQALNQQDIRFQLDVFKESLGMAAAGNLEGARRVAKMGGQDIPDNILNNPVLLRQIEVLKTEAERLYPNMPAAQQEYIAKGVQGLTDAATGHGQLPDAMADPSYPYTGVPNPPQPPETSTPTNRRPLEFELKRQALLDIGYSVEDATMMAMGRKTMTDQDVYTIATRIVNMEMPSSSFGIRPEQRQARLQEVIQELRAGTFAAPAAPAGPAGAAPAQPTPNAAPTPAQPRPGGRLGSIEPGGGVVPQPQASAPAPAPQGSTPSPITATPSTGQQPPAQTAPVPPQSAAPSAPPPNMISEPARPQDEQEYAQLPPGTPFIDPQGNQRIKPYEPRFPQDWQEIPMGAPYLARDGSVQIKMRE